MFYVNEGRPGGDGGYSHISATQVCAVRKGKGFLGSPSLNRVSYLPLLEFKSRSQIFGSYRSPSILVHNMHSDIKLKPIFSRARCVSLKARVWISFYHGSCATFLVLNNLMTSLLSPISLKVWCFNKFSGHQANQPATFHTSSCIWTIKRTSRHQLIDYSYF